MSDEKKKKEEKEAFGIDLGLGEISFGGLFEGIGNLIESIGRVAKEGGVVSEEGEIAGLGDKIKGVYGFTVRTMAGGEPKVETFGNIKKTAKGPVVEEVREPIVDLFDEEDHILVVAELPGIGSADVNLDVEKDILTLSAETGDRQYHKEIVLPSEVDEST
ncbi:Hsp20/alpha crystallin family protein, partial [Acidobacteria bacterium AH-259-G07]|nr:Hsp20/alpha crystallin family protein [Acidobacteria bacterium AH-259-G07]